MGGEEKIFFTMALWSRYQRSDCAISWIGSDRYSMADYLVHYGMSSGLDHRTGTNMQSESAVWWQGGGVLSPHGTSAAALWMDWRGVRAFLTYLISML